jgi:tetratricopeptide (TPR) repeat protein
LSADHDGAGSADHDGAESAGHGAAAGRDAAGQPRRGGRGRPGGQRKGARSARGTASAPGRAASRPGRADRRSADASGGDRAPIRQGPALPVPPEATADRLDPGVAAELRSLPKTLADRVAAHVVAAGVLIDDDPELAYQHAREARRLAGRVGAVREALGLTAHATGRYAEALPELRASRRLGNDPEVLPVIADCERGLGRPERAVAVAADPDVPRLSPAGRVELLLVVSGARRDLGQPAAAVLALESPELRSGEVAPWTHRLWYGYAEALLAAGRTDEAVEWFTAVAQIDEDDTTDAAARATELTGHS